MPIFYDLGFQEIHSIIEKRSTCSLIVLFSLTLVGLAFAKCQQEKNKTKNLLIVLSYSSDPCWPDAHGFEVRIPVEFQQSFDPEVAVCRSTVCWFRGARTG